MRLSKKFSGALLSVGASLAFVLALYTLKPGIVEDLENRTWDWRARRVADATRADKRIKLIVVDQSSLDFFEKEYSLTWPLPRDAYAHVISFLEAAGAKGLAFDMLFTESSSMAVEGDLRFANAMNGKLPVVHALNLESYEKFIRSEKLDVFRARQFALSKAQNWEKKYFRDGNIREFQSATLPIPELIEKSTAIGTVHATPDSDGIYRRYQTGGKLLDIPVIGLPFSLLEATGGQPSATFDPKYNVIRMHGPSGTYEEFPFAAIIQAEADRKEGKPPRVPLESFRDAWVFFGVTAPGLLDLRPTSLEERGNGVELVAATFDNILHSDFVRTPSVTSNVLAAAALVLLATSIAFGARDLTAQIGMLLFLMLAAISGAFYAAAQGVWVPVIVPSTGLFMAAFLGVAIQYQIEGRQARFLRKAFQSYVSPQVVDRLVSQPELLSLNGERRELSIFFSDVEGFTSLAERVDPSTLVPVLNEYLSLMSRLIQESGGTVDKYVGDAVVAFWNAPIPVANHAERAVQTAIRCQQKLDELAAHFQEEYGTTLRTRIGVNTAQVTVGNFGSEDRFTFTMIGDGVNLASRIESINKVFGTRLLITEQTVSELQAKIPLREVGRIRVAGKKEAVGIFEPYFSKDQWIFTGERLDQYREGLKKFENKDFSAALFILSELLEDPVSKAYALRIERMLEEEEIDPNWSPVWEFSEK